MSHKRLITFSDRTEEMMAAIKAHTGFARITDVVTRGIELLYKRTFTYGRDPLKAKKK